MLDLAYELHGRPVYTGVCRLHGRDIEDDWMMFDWREQSLLRRVPSTVVLSVDQGWMVPVHVAHALVSCGKDCGEDECACVSCECEITTAWEYCETCLCPLCEACANANCCDCTKCV